MQRTQTRNVARPTWRGYLRSQRFQRTLWLWIFLLPAILLMLIFLTVPAISSLLFSFYDWQAFRQGEWVGLANFRRLFTNPFRRDFFNALGHNVQVVVVMLVVQNGLGLLLAYALSRKPFGYRFYRVVVFLPVILSLVITAFLWQLFLNPLFGPINFTLRELGLGALARPWLGDATTALPTLMAVNIWRWVGFPTLIFLAGINAIPEEYNEAARLDGADDFTVFRRITIPLLASSFTITTVLTFVGSFEWFELPYVMSGINGQPARSTDVLALMFYRTAFGGVDSGNSDVGLGAAVSTILFLIVGLGSVVGALILRKRELEL